MDNDFTSQNDDESQIPKKIIKPDVKRYKTGLLKNYERKYRFKIRPRTRKIWDECGTTKPVLNFKTNVSTRMMQYFSCIKYFLF